MNVVRQLSSPQGVAEAQAIGAAISRGERLSLPTPWLPPHRMNANAAILGPPT